ncbi:DUF3293 domain-containing protein [Deinococcus altitudinis]|uniref:DUF3293 domain-containing protein n=1 Tax=Deinococcus altitudinis TaxID=468914 RepID=UPI003892C51C
MTGPTPEDHFRAAFLETDYGTPGERFQLTPAREGPAPLFMPAGRWAVLTAHNPGGEQQAQPVNEEAQHALERQLSGFPCLRGLNGGGKWAEASVIVSGLPLRTALRLGREFAQVAVLYGSGRRAALVWCASGRVERFWVSARGSGAERGGAAGIEDREGREGRLRKV